MKKARFIICAVALLFFLCACESKDEKAYREAKHLLEEGDYNGAISAFEAIKDYAPAKDGLIVAQNQKQDYLYNTACSLSNTGDYDGAIELLDKMEPNERVESKRSEVKELWFKEKFSAYYGDWISASQEHRTTLFEDRHGIDENGNFQFQYDENGLYVTIPTEYHIKMETFLGVPCLIKDGQRYFHEEDISKVVEEIKITDDNFGEYFAVSPVILCYNYPQSGEVPTPYLIQEIYINEKYKNLAFEYSYASISFNCEYYYCEYEATWNGYGFELKELRKIKREETWGPYDTISPCGYRGNLFGDINLNMSTMEPYSLDTAVCDVRNFFHNDPRTDMVNNDPICFKTVIFEISKITDASGTLLLYKDSPQT